MTVTIIDSFGFFFRSFYALPPLRNAQGFPTGLLTGFINFVNRMEKEHTTDYLVFALDAKGKSFRNSIYPEYKANRSEAPEDLKLQLPIAIEWIEKMGFKTLSKDGFEADDVIATLVRLSREQGFKVRIITHDKDMYQLIDDGNVVIYDASKNIEIDEAGCFEKFGVYPKDFIEFQSLLGDSSDNVPGVKGIGQKGASALINEYKTVENMVAHLDTITPARTQTALRNGIESAHISRELVTLRNDVFDAIDFEELKLPEKNPVLKLAEELEKYDMNAVLARAKNAAGKEQHAPSASAPSPARQSALPEYTVTLLDSKEKLDAALAAIPDDALVAFDTETTNLDVRRAKLVGFSFAYNDTEAFYVPTGHHYLGVGDQVSLEACKAAIRSLCTRRLVGQNLKYDMAILRHALGIVHEGFYADTMVLAWLIEPEQGVGLDKLAKFYFDHEMIAFKETVAKGEDFSSVEIEKAADYAAEDAFVTLQLFHKLMGILELQSPEMKEEYFRVEVPFINTLIDMESHGIKIDAPFFEGLKAISTDALKKLERDIYDATGREFNINSTKQLGSILFEELKLPPVKKTKTGYSTDDTTLTKLAGAHPVIAMIQEYRELFKLHTTYIEPLLKLAGEEPDRRVHTSFLQTGTATGRLSSKNPNLQNIPTRTELGRQIREGFVAEEGYLLVGLDYSQIELRLLAHFSEDPTLIEAFREEKDIHLETARKIFGDEEAASKRGLAKSVNFGLLYGMGSRKLSETVGISSTEAKQVIENYFSTFASVKKYFETIKADSKKEGFVSTLLGRRRYFDYANAGGMQLAMYERECVNSKFQGSAADLVKLSMLEVYKRFGQRDDVRMLLQIHDELVFEIKEESVEEASREIQEIMENVVELKIPLRCNKAVAKNWKELK